MNFNYVQKKVEKKNSHNKLLWAKTLIKFFNTMARTFYEMKLNYIVQISGRDFMFYI